MINQIKYLVLATFFALSFPAAANWSINDNIALESRVFEVVGEYKYGLFGVEWDRSSDCSPAVNFYLMKSRALGKIKSLKRSTEKMVVSIGNRSWSGDTALAAHENGFVAVFMASSDLIDAIQSGQEIRVEPFKGKRIFVFDGRESKEAIVGAKRNCRR